MVDFPASHFNFLGGIDPGTPVMKLTERKTPQKKKRTFPATGTSRTCEASNKVILLMVEIRLTS